MSNFYYCAFYLSLWLVKALPILATPAMLCSDRRSADCWHPHDVTNFEFDLFGFFVGDKGSTPRKPLRRDQKTASVMIADLTHCHKDLNSRSQR